ncbi:MAG: sigma-70 family RNA polymerase sigma factor [Bacteroidia bacterium]
MNNTISQKPRPAGKDLVAGIQKGGRQADDAIRQIYFHYLPPILHLIRNCGGSTADGEDVFQEAIMVVYGKIISGAPVLHSCLYAYLKTVSVRIWLKRLRKLKREYFPAIWDDTMMGIPPENPEETESAGWISRILPHLSPACREVLFAAVWENKPMRTICNEMGYGNEQVARNKKHRCINYLRKLFYSIPREDYIPGEMQDILVEK